MEKYKPIKELPDDIKQLPREETVCQFCGVSYLIHHEISKLEDRVRELEKEVKRLKSVEDDKASWDIERSRLIEERTHALEGKGRLEEELRCMGVEVRDCHSECERMKEVQLSQESENNVLRRCQTRALRGLKSIQSEVSTLHQCKTEISQLLTTTSNSLTQFKQQCLLHITSYATRTREAVTKLALENRSLLKKLEQQRQEWMSAETNLNQLLEEKQRLLEKEQHWSQQHQIKIQALNEKAGDLEDRLSAKDEEIISLQRSQEASKNSAHRLLAEATENCRKAERRVKELEVEIAQVKSDQTASKAALEKANVELKKMEKELQSSLTLCQDRLASAETRAKALQLEHSRELETMKSEHECHLDSLLKRTKEEQDKALQEANRTHFSSQQEIQAKLTEIKSTLTACELEKSRLVSSLQEQLQKEKDIADRELTDHLNTVKALELSLLQEKRVRKELEERVSKNSVETEQTRSSLKSADRKRLDMENKLSEAYQEISTLQAIVERECEERERLTKELSLVKSARKSQTKKPH